MAKPGLPVARMDQLAQHLPPTKPKFRSILGDFNRMESYQCFNWLPIPHQQVMYAIKENQNQSKKRLGSRKNVENVTLEHICREYLQSAQLRRALAATLPWH